MVSAILLEVLDKVHDISALLDLIEARSREVTEALVLLRAV